MKVSGLLLLSIAFLVNGSQSRAQVTSLPHLGFAEADTYQHSDTDDVDLSNGNVFVHIPLVSFPQLGNRLRLQYIVRFNAPQWQTYVDTAGYNWFTGGTAYKAMWGIADYEDAMVQTPIGVDVVRD